MSNNKIVIGIPGLWQTTSEIIQRIVDNSGGYIFAGNIIKNMSVPDEFYEADIYEHDENLQNAFKIAGCGEFSQKQLDSIDKHKYTIYITANVSSLDIVYRIIKVGNGILKSGGLGVKIENSGLASTPEKWNSLNEKPEIPYIFDAFVNLVSGDDFYYSCGMHCFGLPDVICFSNQVKPQYAAKLMRTFCLYNLMEKPNLQDNETFSIDVKNPHFIMKLTECTYFEKDDLFHNPYGVWVLSKK